LARAEGAENAEGWMARAEDAENAENDFARAETRRTRRMIWLARRARRTRRDGWLARRARSAQEMTPGCRTLERSSLLEQVTYKLRGWCNRGDVQGVARPRARHIEQMPLGVVYLLQVAFVSDVLNA